MSNQPNLRSPSPPKIVEKSTIKEIIDVASHSEMLPYIEHAFLSYSNQNAVVPPVGTLTFDAPPGEVHIKYGYIKSDPIYVIKIASGFYENAALGLPTGNGLNLVFDQRTGELKTLLLDECYLTDVRTAFAGAVAAKYLAPSNVNCIGIIGTGVQARLQLKYLKTVVDCKKVMVWGRSAEKLAKYKADMELEGFEIETTLESDDLAKACKLIVTTTPAKAPLLQADHLQPGTLITAMGADTPGKQELDIAVLEKADLIVMDSRSQCEHHGEIHKAFHLGRLGGKQMVELGELIASGNFDRKDEDIIVADLTGIATQDIQISSFVLDRLK